MRVVFVEVKEGKNTNWISLYAYIPQLDVNKKYKFDFCGTELSFSASMSQEKHDLLCEKLSEKLGYAPYDLKRVKSVINGHMMIDLDIGEWMD